MDRLYGNIRNAFVGTVTPYYVKSEEDGYFYLESNNIKEGQINRNTEVFINEEFYKKQIDKLLHTGDLVMVQSGHVGHTAVIPRELDGIAAHALIMFQKPIGKTDPYFINYQLQTRDSKKKLDYITTGNTIKHILASEMKQYVVNVPVIEEQNVISDFFHILDNLITLHKRKLDSLKQLKKGYLQNMFPHKGKSVPKIRFVGFADGWETKKLGDVIESELKGKAKAEMCGSESAYLDANYLNGGKISYVDSPTNVNSDDVLILWDGSQAGTVYYGFEGALGSTLKAYRPKYSGAFLYQQLKKSQQKIYDSYRTPNIPHVVKTFTDEFVISVSTLPEQIIIGDLFHNLDNQINTQKTKMNQLKQLKSAYLQKMFV